MTPLPDLGFESRLHRNACLLQNIALFQRLFAWSLPQGSRRAYGTLNMADAMIALLLVPR
jgi:hypothetical protein